MGELGGRELCQSKAPHSRFSTISQYNFLLYLGRAQAVANSTCKNAWPVNKTCQSNHRMDRVYAGFQNYLKVGHVLSGSSTSKSTKMHRQLIDHKAYKQESPPIGGQCEIRRHSSQSDWLSSIILVPKTFMHAYASTSIFDFNVTATTIRNQIFMQCMNDGRSILTQFLEPRSKKV